MPDGHLTSREKDRRKPLTQRGFRSARTSGWVLIKTKTVRIWEFCAHEAPGIGIQSGSLE